MEKIKLYHYSDSDFKGYIKPGFFGLNNYTRNSTRESGVDRIFFYSGRGREQFFYGVKFCYIAEIEKSKIYDLERDIKGLKDKNLTDVLAYIKRLGYSGFSGNNGFNCVCLFRAIKYIDKKALTKAY